MASDPMFKFRLQRLLDLREQREKEVAAELARAEALRDAARAAHESLESARRINRERLHAAQQDAGTVGALSHYAFVLAQLDRELGETAQRLGEAEQSAEQVRQQLSAASIDRRVLDRLRERDAEEWRHAASQEDLQAMDAIALQRYGRPSPATGTPRLPEQG